MCQCSPTFQFWDMIMKFEILILIFVRSHREKNFCLYIEVLEALVPLFFALDHVNYARWLPIHIRDMRGLPKEVECEFINNGRWVIQKTSNLYSSIPVDQAHEQENKIVKECGGAIGLMESPVALRRWSLCGPELTRLMKEFDIGCLTDISDTDLTESPHHEQSLSFQNNFHKQVFELSSVITKMGNPFLDDFPELVTLDSRICANPLSVETVRCLEKIGKEQCTNYVSEVIEKRSRSIHSSIKRNSLPLFEKVEAKRGDHQLQKLKSLKSNTSLFGQLFIAMQTRRGDLNEFFSHEIHSYPPSLANCGIMTSGKKADLTNFLSVPQSEEPPLTFDCKVIDGGVLVHALPTASATTFDDYADRIFMPHLLKELQTCTRLDVVWDSYLCDSIKAVTRAKRGCGVRRKISPQTKLPNNWPDFLKNSTNKEELFSFLSSKLPCLNLPHKKEMHMTSGEQTTATSSLISL